MGTLAAYPGLVGLGIDEGAAVVVRGCRLSVVGESGVVACISPSSGPPRHVETLMPGEQANLLKLSLSADKPRRSRTPFRLAACDSAGSD
jgi:cyanophycinase